MATTERHKLPATILSRCQQFVFRMISPAEILDHLRQIAAREGVRIDDAALNYVVKASEGSMRDAQSLLDQIISFSGQEVVNEDVRDVLGFIPNEILDRTIDALANRDSKGLLENIGIVHDQGLNIQQYVREFIGRVRDLLLAKLALDEKILGSAEEKRHLEASSERFSEQDLIRFFDLLLRLENDLRQTAQPRFHLEVGLIRLARVGHVRDIEEVIRDLKQGTSSTAGMSAPSPKLTNVVREPSPSAPKAMESTQQTSDFAKAFRDRVETRSAATAVHLEKADRIDRTDSGIQILMTNPIVFASLDNKEHRKILDDVGSELVGKPVSVSLIMKKQPASDEKNAGSEAGQTMESAREEPLVKRFLEVFRGDLAQVKPSKGE
jgi:DNA polymerase-3 subunit gamma/tau